MSDPRNGDVVITGVAVGSMATYTCDNGFELIGEQSRTCQPNGRWTDKDPICKGLFIWQAFKSSAFKWYLDNFRSDSILWSVVWSRQW